MPFYGFIQSLGQSILNAPIFLVQMKYSDKLKSSMCLPHVPTSFFLMYFMYNCSKIVLPCRSPHWDDISHPSFYNGLSSPRSSFVRPKAVILKAPWKFTKVKCPVTDANRDA